MLNFFFIHNNKDYLNNDNCFPFSMYLYPAKTISKQHYPLTHLIAETLLRKHTEPVNDTTQWNFGKKANEAC